MTSWVTKPEAIGRSSTAVIGTGASFRRRGSPWQLANEREMQDAVAPESTRAYVRIVLWLGNESETERKKWSGEKGDA